MEQNDEITGMVIDILFNHAHFVRHSTPKNSPNFPWIKMYPRRGYIKPQLHGKHTVDLGYPVEVRLQFDYLEIHLLDALSFLARHERRPIDDANEQIEKLQKENKRLREGNKELRSRRAPEAAMWNAFMGRS